MVFLWNFNMVIPAFYIEVKHIRPLCKVGKSNLPILEFHFLFKWTIIFCGVSPELLAFWRIALLTLIRVNYQGFLSNYADTPRESKFMDGLVHKIGMKSSRLIIPQVHGLRRNHETTRLPPMWSWFDSQTRRHLWVEFVGSLLYIVRFFPRYSGFPLTSKTKICFDLFSFTL